MTLPKWTTWLLLAVLGAAGCAGLQPPPTPQALSPADLIKSIPQGNNTTLVNVAPPCCVHQTLPDFLGITRCCYQAGVCCETIRAEAAYCFPALAGVIQPGAGILATAPDGAPASVAAAAGIKANEDAAAAKIAALRYLALFGCGCYNKDGSVEKAFYDSLGDCTEEVRYEAVLALRKVACGCCTCGGCNEKACCSEKIQKKLHEMAYETNDMGCPMEPSERVRREARLTLRQCGPPICKPEPATEKPESQPIHSSEGKMGPTNPPQGAADGEKPLLPPPAKSDQPLPPQK